MPPKKSDAAIARKLAHIDEQIADLGRNEVVAVRVGDVTRHTLGEEIAFHQWRRSVLVQASGETTNQIAARRTVLESAAGPDVKAAKYGNARGLPDSSVNQVVEMELLDIALDEHPSQARRRAQGGR